MVYYRQHIMNYVRSGYSAPWSHVLVMDVDIGCSLSPLGMLAALGRKARHAPVAARGVMMVPGALGTLYAPYDYR
jgi:hypothetical protein